MFMLVCRYVNKNRKAKMNYEVRDVTQDLIDGAKQLYRAAFNSLQ